MRIGYDQDREDSVLKKRILAIGIVFLFLISAVKAEIASARSFAGSTDADDLCRSSYSSDESFICPDIPEHQAFRVSERTNSFISHHRRTSFFRYFPDGSLDLHQYINPKDVRETKQNTIFPGREHHPGEEIIRYIHDQDGEKEHQTFL